MSECPTCERDDFASEQGMKVHHKRAHGESLVPTKVCEECDEEFQIVDYNKPNRFCSMDCLHEHNKSDKECAACGRQIPGAQKYCCQTCHVEDRHDRPRPGDLESVLWLLYRYEGYNITETFRRQRAIRGAESCLTIQGVRDKLSEMGIKREHHTGRWTLQSMDASDVGGPKPEGDESWKQHYSSA